MNAIKHRLSHTRGLVGMGTKPSFMDTFKNSILFLNFTDSIYNQFITNAVTIILIFPLSKQ